MKTSANEYPVNTHKNDAQMTTGKLDDLSNAEACALHADVDERLIKRLEALHARKIEHDRD